MTVLAHTGLHLFGPGCKDACPETRSVVLLASMQALLMTGNVLVISTSALVGVALAPAAWLATLPLALQLVSTMATTLPASMFMQRAGRPAGFSLGASAGLAGAALASVAILSSHFGLFLAASLLLGIFNGFGGFYRFAAAEVSSPDHRGQAVSYVVGGGLVAALAGPRLALWSGGLLEAEFAASYAALAAVYLPAVVLPLLLRLPAGTTDGEGGRGRPLLEVARQPVFVVAALAAIIGYSAMALLTTVTPLAMEAHAHTFAATALVIQWHVMAMFLPSLFTGRLISRYGAVAVIAAGSLLGVGAVAAALAGVALGHFMLSLVLLGVSWNFLYVGGTTLLSESHRVGERAKILAVHEFALYGSTAAATLVAGGMQHLLGWGAAILAVVPFFVLILVAVTWLTVRRRTEALAG
jgi:MFS family permease